MRGQGRGQRAEGRRGLLTKSRCQPATEFDAILGNKEAHGSHSHGSGRCSAVCSVCSMQTKRRPSASCRSNEWPASPPSSRRAALRSRCWAGNPGPGAPSRPAETPGSPRRRPRRSRRASGESSGACLRRFVAQMKRRILRGPNSCRRLVTCVLRSQRWRSRFTWSRSCQRS